MRLSEEDRNQLGGPAARETYLRDGRGSKGFEWMTESPPPTHNFDAIPTVTQDPDDYRTHAPSAGYAHV